MMSKILIFIATISLQCALTICSKEFYTENSTTPCFNVSSGLREKSHKLYDECLKELKLEEKDVPNNAEEMRKANFNDKCFSKCVFDKMDMNENGQFSPDKYNNFIKNDQKGSPQKVLDFIEKTTATCKTVIEKKEYANEEACKKVARYADCIGIEGTKPC